MATVNEPASTVLLSPFAEAVDIARGDAPARRDVFACCPAHGDRFAEHTGDGVEHEWPLGETEDEAFPSGAALVTVSRPTGPGAEHHDPVGGNLPLYDTSAPVRGTRLSPSFTVGELVTSGGRASDVARISVPLVRLLQALRDHVGRPVRITSGYRSYLGNIDVYSKRKQTPTKSRHSSGEAADVKIAGMTGLEIAKAAIDVWGLNIGVGVAGDFAHVDVRPTWGRWTYFKDPARDAATIRELDEHRRKRRARGTPPAAGTTSSAGPAAAARGRLVVAAHPLLRSHAGTRPDLILRWNAPAPANVVDVALHFHGFSSSKAQMRLDEKERIAGLDLVDPENPARIGRTAPTLTILPRGSNNGAQGGNGYDFHGLTGAGAVTALIDDGLQRVGAALGRRITRGRLVLPAHSGGGAALMHALTQVDPDEVHVYDALYGRVRPHVDPIGPLVAWTRARLAPARRAAAPHSALRVVYRCGTKDNSERLAAILAGELRGLPPALAARFRVERATDVAHLYLPRAFGWRLLADAGADLPGVTARVCPAPRRGREAEGIDEAWLDSEDVADHENVVDEAFDETFVDREDLDDEAFVDEYLDQEDLHDQDLHDEDLHDEDLYDEHVAREHIEHEHIEHEHIDDELLDDTLLEDEELDEAWLDGEEDGGQRPSALTAEDEAGLRSLWEPALIAMAVARGERDENRLANLVFDRRHPERNGTVLRAGEPGFATLASEWRAVRDTLVRPQLAKLSSTPAPPAPPAPASPAATGRAARWRSHLARPAARQWVGRERPGQWAQSVYGLVVHTTGGSLVCKAVLRRQDPTAVATDHYYRSHGTHYVCGWSGAAGGQLVQVAEDRYRANGVGVAEQLRSVRGGRWTDDVAAVAAEQWRRRWPDRAHPLALLPGTTSANAAYVHVEMPPAVVPWCKHIGPGGLAAEPMRPGLRYTRAQHETIADLAVELAARHGWTGAWWDTPQLLGHEDLSPISRNDKGGGWDPGALRAEPWFDWAFVKDRIKRAVP
jgi:hypothetical protein